MNSNSDYRSILHEHFNARRMRNPAYSLRCFARDIGWSPSRLSEALNGKAGLSLTKAKDIAQRLALSSAEKELFTTLVIEKHGRSATERLLAKKRVLEIRPNDDLNPISIESFKVIRDWYHLAIVELLKIRDFRHSSEWIAKRLKIPVDTADSAIKRLLQVGLLVQKNKRLVAAAPRNAIGNGVSSESIKTFHTQILNKAIDSIYGQPRDSRYVSASMIAIDIKDLPIIKAKLQEFQDSLCREFVSEIPKESLYCISMQFFSLMEVSGK